jgi:hypothetical protein
MTAVDTFTRTPDAAAAFEAAHATPCDDRPSLVEVDEQPAMPLGAGCPFWQRTDGQVDRCVLVAGHRTRHKPVSADPWARAS